MTTTCDGFESSASARCILGGLVVGWWSCQGPEERHLEMDRQATLIKAWLHQAQRVPGNSLEGLAQETWLIPVDGTSGTDRTSAQATDIFHIKTALPVDSPREQRRIRIKRPPCCMSGVYTCSLRLDVGCRRTFLSSTFGASSWFTFGPLHLSSIQPYNRIINIRINLLGPLADVLGKPKALH